MTYKLVGVILSQGLLHLLVIVTFCQSPDDRGHDHKLERLLGGGSTLASAHRSQLAHHQPGHLRPHRLLRHHALHHAQAHQQHVLELRRRSLQIGKVGFELFNFA